jgi:hypothetical protein
MYSRSRATFASVFAVAVALAVPASAGAAIGFRSEAHASAHGAHSVFVPRPAGVQQGDVMVATVAVGGPHIAISSPGWTAVRTTTAGPGVQVFSFYRVATRYEMLAYYFGASSGHNDVSAGISAYTGVDPTNPVDAVSDAFGPSPSANSIPSVTTTSDADMVVGAIGLGSVTTATPEAPVVVRYHAAVGSAGVTSGDYVQPTAGTTSPHPYATGGPAGEKATQAIALRAAPVAPDPGPPPPDPKPKPSGWQLADGSPLDPGALAALPSIKPKAGVRVSAKGTVAVPVACPAVATAGCRGTIALSVLKPKPTLTAARRRKVVRRKATFKLAAGRHKTVRAPLSVRALRRRVRHGRARVRMVVTVATPSGNAVSKATFTVRARRTAHRFRRRR